MFPVAPHVTGLLPTAVSEGAPGAVRVIFTPGLELHPATVVISRLV